MFCRKCGVHLKGNERFCPRCGAEVATGANDIWEQNAYGNTNAPVVEEADISIKTSKSDKKPNLKNRKKKKKSKNSNSCAARCSAGNMLCRNIWFAYFR